MHHVIALFAGCLLYPPADDPCKEAREAQYAFLRSHDAREMEWNANGTIRSMKATGIVLRPGLASLKVGQPAPEILDAIGPALLARGTEELRVSRISRTLVPGQVDIRFDQFIGGHEVLWAGVTISVKEQTNEVTQVVATFMPDRGLDHEPRLSSDEARAKAAATLRARAQRSFGPEAQELTIVATPAATLAYEFEEVGAAAILGGALVWIFSAADGKSPGYQCSVDAATGKVLRVWATWVN
jgi:hypothetical protein